MSDEILERTKIKAQSIQNYGTKKKKNRHCVSRILGLCCVEPDVTWWSNCGVCSQQLVLRKLVIQLLLDVWRQHDYVLQAEMLYSFRTYKRKFRGLENNHDQLLIILIYTYILIPTRLLFLYFLFKFATSILVLKTWKVSVLHRVAFEQNWLLFFFFLGLLRPTLHNSASWYPFTHGMNRK